MAERDGVDEIIDHWRRERPELDASPVGVIGRISRLSREIEARLEPVYAEHGLEHGWHDVLATLRRGGPPYELRASEFTKGLMITSSGATKRLDRLERAGLITRRPDPGDRRGILIALTDEGRRMIDAVTGAAPGQRGAAARSAQRAGARAARRPAAQAAARTSGGLTRSGRPA